MKRCVLLLCLALVSPTFAQEEPAEPETPEAPAITAPSEPAAFEPQLVRLVEILGSLEVLRGLCGEETGDWRQRAQAVIDAEGGDRRLRRRLVAAYNRGNRALTAYSTCTPSAVFAIDGYMREGERISRDVLVRYGE